MTTLSSLVRKFKAASAGVVGVCAIGSTLATDTFTGPGTDNARVSTRHQPYWVEQVANGLRYPSSIVWLPNGDALVAERQGGLRILRKGPLDAKPLGGVPLSFQNIFNGLKDIALDPDYRTNQTLYLLISEGTYEAHHAAVYRARHTSTGLLDVERIFRSKDDIGGFGHIATRMLFLPDRTLLVGVAEDHFHKHMAQRLDSHIGKILRIDRDGSVPRDNPFLKTPGALPEIWSYGHRVQTGLHRDADTGVIWEIEPGPRGGDELNILKMGRNFGWAEATWGFDYDGNLAGPTQSGPDIEDPILVWMPSATPSGLTRYRGTAYPAWDGDFFVGHLSGKALERLRIEGTNVVLREKMLMDLGERIRDVKVGPDNLIYILTDHPDGRVLRLRPGRPSAHQINQVAHKLKEVPPKPESLFAHSDPEKGKEAFLERCAGCHTVGSIIQGGVIGPDLASVYGRRAGTQIGFRYSAAMSDSSKDWIHLTLNQFLRDPSGYVPGTTMTSPPVIEEDVRWQIIAFLAQPNGQ